MKTSIDRIHSARLIGERILLRNLADVCRLHQDPDVMRTLSADGTILSDEVTKRSVTRGIEHWAQHGFGWWIFRSRPDRQFVGRAGLMRYKMRDEQLVGLGYAVLSEFWNQGYATEMAACCLETGFGAIGLKEIASWALPENSASLRVIEKLGFHYRKDLIFAGLRHRFYRLPAREWKGC